MPKPVLIPPKPVKYDVEPVRIGDFLVIKRSGEKRLIQIITIRGRVELLDVLNGTYFHGPKLDYKYKYKEAFTYDELLDVLAANLNLSNYSLENWSILTKQEAGKILSEGFPDE